MRKGFLIQNLYYQSMGAHGSYAMLLSGAVNMAVAESSKAQYKTAIRHIYRVEEELGVDMSLPFTIPKTLNYVGRMLYTRKCQYKTVNRYLIAHSFPQTKPHWLRHWSLFLVLVLRVVYNTPYMVLRLGYEYNVESSVLNSKSDRE